MKTKKDDYVIHYSNGKENLSFAFTGTSDELFIVLTTLTKVNLTMTKINNLTNH